MSGDMSRSQWMATRGKEIYEPWTESLVESIGEDVQAFPDDHFWNGPTVYAKTLAERITSGEVFEESVADKLLPYADEIMKYTSAGAFMTPDKDGVVEAETVDEAITLHARDNIIFGAVAPVLVAHMAWLGENEPDIAGLTQDDYETDNSERVYAAVQDGQVDVSNTLKDPEYVAAVQQLAGAGFGDLSARLSWAMKMFDDDGVRKDILSHIQEELSDKGVLLVGKVKHADGTEGYAVHPEVRSVLREKLRRQNHEGIPSDQLEQAGDIVELKGPISSGCPVKKSPTIALMCNLVSRAIDSNFSNERE